MKKRFVFIMNVQDPPLQTEQQIAVDEASPSLGDQGMFEGHHTSELNNLIGLARINPAIVEGNDDLKGLLQRFMDTAKVVSTVNKTPDTTQPVKTNTEGGIANDTTVDDPEETSGTQDEDEPVITGRFSKSKKNVVAIEKIEDLPTVLESEFGIKATEKDNGVNTFLSSAKKWRDDSQKLPSIEKELNGIKEDLLKLPDDIAAALVAWNNGEDYKKAIEVMRSPLDFSKDFKSQEDKLTVLKHYFPEATSDVSDEDIEKDPTVKTLISAAEKLFNQQKAAYNAERTRMQNEAKQRRAEFVESVNGSVQTLKANFGSIVQNDVNKIKDLLSSPGSLQSLFFDRNGKVLPDAAKKLAFALFGEEEISLREKKAENRGKSKANEGNIAPEASKPNVAKQAPAKINSDTNKKLEGLQSFQGSKLRW